MTGDEKGGNNRDVVRSNDVTLQDYGNRYENIGSNNKVPPMLSDYGLAGRSDVVLG